MAIIIELNENIENILREVEKLNDLEQKEVLAYARVLNYQKKKRKPIAKPKKGLKPLTMEEIDDIKHEARKYYAK